MTRNEQTFLDLRERAKFLIGELRLARDCGPRDWMRILFTWHDLALDAAIHLPNLPLMRPPSEGYEGDLLVHRGNEYHVHRGGVSAGRFPWLPGQPLVGDEELLVRRDGLEVELIRGGRTIVTIPDANLIGRNVLAIHKAAHQRLVDLRGERQGQKPKPPQPAVDDAEIERQIAELVADRAGTEPRLMWLKSYLDVNPNATLGAIEAAGEQAGHKCPHSSVNGWLLKHKWIDHPTRSKAKRASSADPAVMAASLTADNTRRRR